MSFERFSGEELPFVDLIVISKNNHQMATLFITWILRQLLSNRRLPPSLLAAETSLYGGRRWETLDARVCGSVWEGWRPAPAQQPTASSSSNILLTFISLPHVHTRSVTASKPLMVKMNNSDHLTTVKYSGKTGSWHSCGCYFSQPICPNTLADPPSPTHHDTGTSNGTGHPQQDNGCWHTTKTAQKQPEEHHKRQNMASKCHRSKGDWAPWDVLIHGCHLGSAVGMEGFFNLKSCFPLEHCRVATININHFIC